MDYESFLAVLSAVMSRIVDKLLAYNTFISAKMEKFASYTINNVRDFTAQILLFLLLCHTSFWPVQSPVRHRLMSFLMLMHGFFQIYSLVLFRYLRTTYWPISRIMIKSVSLRAVYFGIFLRHPA
ncbi:MAG: hypothetical protein LUE27_04000 [Clostridia bacterium]|nr:hypothetical protein [Clostridia bacterium]